MDAELMRDLHHELLVKIETMVSTLPLLYRCSNRRAHTHGYYRQGVGAVSEPESGVMIMKVTVRVLGSDSSPALSVALSLHVPGSFGR